MTAATYTRREADRDQIEIFVQALFRHANSGARGFVSIRSFVDDGSNKVFRFSTPSLAGGLKFMMEVAYDDAKRAANAPERVVFCPPIAVFNNNKRAREEDIIEALALSAECDQKPQAARITLENVLGPATIVVRSGGKWTDPETGEIEDKLHLHWRLKVPARTADDIKKLKRARRIGTELVGG